MEGYPTMGPLAQVLKIFRKLHSTTQIVECGDVGAHESEELTIYRQALA